MIHKTRFKYPSDDGIHSCQAYKWENSDIPVRGILQIAHGMQEHMSRYDEFAEFLCNNGFMVVGNDHLGHGYTVKNKSELGFFCPKDADEHIVEDLQGLKTIIAKDHPGIPYFLFGHSMGSFIARKYIVRHPDELSGVILSGTCKRSPIQTGAGIIISKVFGLFSKGHNESKFIDKLSFGGFNKKGKPKNEWVMRNKEKLAIYNADPLCMFKFKTNGYTALFSILHFVNKKKNIESIPKNLPIFLISGEKDPVGSYGREPRNLFNCYKKAGIRDVSLKIYKGFHHEVISDIEREKTFKDILTWMKRKIANC